MTRLRRAVAVPLLAAGFMVLAAAPAAAEPVGEIVKVKDDTNPLVVTYAASNDGKPVELARNEFKVQLTPSDGTPGALLDGRPADTRAATRTAMIALDVSGSMLLDPRRVPAAKQAARTFLERVPDDVKVGLVTFGDPADLAIEPTLDRARVRRAIEELQPDRNADTALYEAVIIAAKATRGADSRTVVLLTDGQNEDFAGKTWTAEDKPEVQAALKGVRLTAVSVDPEGVQELEELATGQDRVIAATDATVGDLLQNAFSDQAGILEKTVSLRVEVPAALVRKEGNLTVRAVAQGTGQPLPEATVGPVVFGPVAVPAQAAPPIQVAAEVDPRFSAVTRPIAFGAIALLFVALVVLATSAIGALGGAAGKQSEVVRRLSVYTLVGREPKRMALAEQTTALGGSTLARTAVDVADRITRSRNIDRSLDARLDAAGLPLRAGEWVVLHAGSTLGTMLLFLLLGAGRIVPGLIGFLVGVAAPWAFLGLRRSRRETAFLRQLPDTLQLLAGSLKTGYSLPQAMDTVVREARPPISSEFNRALIEARLGVPPEDAMDGIARRTGSRDFSWIVMAIRIQREVGGNLAELLSTVADTLRERERLRRQVSALSAEGRLSGIILAALPLVFTLYLMMVQPDYLNPMFTTPLGLLMLSGGVVLLAVGGFWMSRIVKVKV